MDLDFESKGAVEISMINYVQEIIMSFPQEIGSSYASTPAAEHLFQVREEKDAKLIPKEQAVPFQHTVAKLLFVSTRAHQDIQMVVAFLTTCIKSPDEDDWGKLKRS